METYTSQADDLYQEANEIEYPDYIPPYTSCYESLLEFEEIITRAREMESATRDIRKKFQKIAASGLSIPTSSLLRKANSGEHNEKCCRNSVVYKASLKTGETDKFYYDSCETSFKLRYNNHNQSFKDSRKINSTELSKAVWKLKQSGLSPEIRWKIVQHATPYQCGLKIGIKWEMPS